MEKHHDMWLGEIRRKFVHVEAKRARDGSIAIGPQTWDLPADIFEIQYTKGFLQFPPREMSLFLLKKLELKEDACILYPRILAKINNLLVFKGGDFNLYTAQVISLTRKRYGLPKAVRPAGAEMHWNWWEHEDEFR